MATWGYRVVKELGLTSLWDSSRDVKYLCAQRFIRYFAFGASSLIIVQFLSQLHVSKAHIGLFMTMTLLGDVLISFALTLFADGIGRRVILASGALLMTISGVVFVLSNAFWVLLVASIFGVISPSGNEIGPFRAIEESVLAHLTPKANLSDIYAWYTLIGTAGAALGQLGSGWLIQILQDAHWTDLEAYRAVFVVYAVLGAVKFFMSLILSKRCEAEKPMAALPVRPTTETDPLLAQTEEDLTSRKESRLRKLIPKISSESRMILFKLSLLFTVDSFASGLVTTSWISEFFTEKFRLAAGTLGTLFFVTSLINAASNLCSASIARRIGLIKTMVFTHLPSAIFLALIPIPDQRWAAMTFLALRSSLASMDTAPRQAFTATAVLASERTAIMGFVNVIRTLAQSGAPSVTGKLAESGNIWIAFVIAGCLKISYDLSMLLMFVGFQAREDS